MDYIMRFIFVALLLFFSLFSGCTKKEEPLTIVTNTWIGYTPLYIAQENGELEKLNIKLLQTVSLSEATELFSIGRGDVVTTTQHEFHILHQHIDIQPIILLDRSNGGDMILANRTTEQLKKVPKINVYLEIDSINLELLNQFIKKNGIPKEHLHYIDMDQSSIQTLSNDHNKATLIVTYTPYNTQLIKAGFQEIASTKSMDNLLVIDALLARTSVIATDKERLQKLKKIIDKNILFIQQHPKQAYTIVKSHLENISYTEFVESLHLIQWINKPDAHTLTNIESIGYKRQGLLL